MDEERGTLEGNETRVDSDKFGKTNEGTIDGGVLPAGCCWKQIDRNTRPRMLLAGAK